MKKLYSIFFCILMLSWVPAAAADFNYAHYASLLQHYVKPGVKIDGIAVAAVAYTALAGEAKKPDSDYSLLLEQLAAFKPETLPGREEQMAFWVNVYNIAAIKTIVDHYPVESITGKKINLLGLPWFRKAITVGGQEYSLWYIENDILLDGFRDLRIHFGINCASVSCPDLLPEPYRAATLFKQLEEQGKKLLADRDKGLLMDRQKKVVYISQIFKFDQKHFDAFAGGAIKFILPYAPPEIPTELKRGDYKVEYLRYDWKANDVKYVR